MGRTLLPFAVGSVSVQPFCCECAAFFNESIIREIITGRYLRPVLTQRMRDNLGGRAYTGRPLVVAARDVVRIVVQKGGDNSRAWEKLDRFLERQIRYRQLRSEETNGRSHRREIQGQDKYKMRSKYNKEVAHGISRDGS